MYVAVDAYVFQPRWLRTGLELFNSMNKDLKSANRDFLMCKPNHNLQGFATGMLRYADAMGH